MKNLGWVILFWAARAAATAPDPPLCVDGSEAISLFAVNGRAIACWDDAAKTCLSIDDNTAVPRPAEPKPAAEVRDDGGTPSACNASTCKPLGPKLAAAVAKARAQSEATKQEISPTWAGAITVTADLKLVAIDIPKTGDAERMTELWNVVGDKPLAVKPPAVFHGSKKHGDEAPALTGALAIGNHAFATWNDCSGGPCDMEIAIEPDGTNRSKAFEGGRTLALANGEYAVISVHTTILDASGRHTGVLAWGGVGPDASSPDGVAIAPDELVLMSEYEPDDKGRYFIHVKITGGKPKLVGKKRNVPQCGT